MTEKEFIVNHAQKISSGRLKTFPDSFLSEDIQCVPMKLPEINLVLGSELFGQFDLTDIKGNPVCFAENYMQAKYILYSNRDKPASINIPSNDEQLQQVVKLYEKHLDSLIREIEQDYKKQFPKEVRQTSIAADIFNFLNLKRY